VALNKEHFSVALYGLILLEGCWINLLHQLYSADHSVLPAVNQPKTLFLLEYSGCSVTLSVIGSHRIVCSQGYEILYNVWECM